MYYEKTIRGMTVRLRAVEESDAEVTYLMRTDPEKNTYIHKVCGTVEDQRRYIERQRKKEGDYLFLVEDLEGRPIGMRGIYDHKGDTAESGRTIGYGNPYQNMEALLLGFDFAFDVLGVRDLYMDAMADNKPIRSIQKKIGAVFVKEEYNENLQATLVYSVLHSVDYTSKRKDLMKLIEKYQNRRKHYEKY